jgi:predicted nucleotide-binding protein
MVYCSQDHLELPSDLAGVTAATYQRQADENFENLQAELGVACTKLKIAIRTAQKKEKN